MASSQTVSAPLNGNMFLLLEDEDSGLDSGKVACGQRDDMSTPMPRWFFNALARKREKEVDHGLETGEVSDSNSEETYPLYNMHPVQPRYLDLSIGVQVFSMKVKRIQGVDKDEIANFDIYGNIVGRDCLDYKRNYLFRRDSQDRIPLGHEGTIALTGPSRRGLWSFSDVSCEFNLFVVRKGEQKGKRLLREKPTVFNYPLNDRDTHKVLTCPIEGPYGAVEIVFAALLSAIQATVQIKYLSEGKGGLSKDGVVLFGRVVAHIICDYEDICQEEIVLFDSEIRKEEISSLEGGRVNLWCPILCVPQTGVVRLVVQLKRGKDKQYTSRVASFSTRSNVAEECKDLRFEFGLFRAKISWSSLNVLPMFHY